jgi:hypothetical protein
LEIRQNASFQELLRCDARYKIMAMRLSLSVNNRDIVRASLRAKGWLGAHVTLSQGIESEEPSKRVWLQATDISEAPNAIHSSWEAVPLSVGDRIEIEVLPDGQSDSPMTITRTSESPSNLFSDVEQARLLLKAIKACDTALTEVADRASDVEGSDEFHKIRSAIGSVLVEIDQQLISPTLRRHPQLLREAEELKLR